MRTRVRGWHWRDNPLRRRSDVVEGWIALAVAVLLLVGTPLAGALAGLWAHDEGRTAATAQRQDRHRVHARVLGAEPGQLPVVQGGREHAFRAWVRWTEPGEGTRTAVTRIPAGTHPGDMVDVWFDSAGRGVAAPPNEVSVWQHTVAVGLCAAGSAAVVTLVGHGLLRRVSLRRRMSEWERDWSRTGPEWTRRRA
ncbi:hypothetical protein [Streptomyces sp. NPDC086787]|uniref:Rv1733c family protein n=1 Tax=Streptomyces sp. NPDC086787 TaxID=3365759 RepID=UPI00380A1893